MVTPPGSLSLPVSATSDTCGVPSKTALFSHKEKQACRHTGKHRGRQVACEYTHTLTHSHTHTHMHAQEHTVLRTELY